MQSGNVSQPEHPVKVLKNVLIPMQDGITLAADAYTPEAEGTFPAIIGYYSPYRKDALLQPGCWLYDRGIYFAQRGYHVYFVDVRGTGGSEGHTSRPYSEQEQQDGYEVVEWLARQPWCNGNVGMMGMSYGFYSTVLVAATTPPHLKAIIPYSGGVDWYDAGWGYEGGNLGGFHFCGFWCALMLAMNSTPPLYRDPDGRWMKVWEEHLRDNVPYLFDWMENDVDGPYYHVASVCKRYERIKAAAMVINGWHDFYPTDPIEFYLNIKAPKRLVAGPWTHGSPDRARPGPTIDIFHEQLRWMDHWLKGIDTGVLNGPPIALYVGEHTPIDEMRTSTAVQRGKWRGEEEFPPKGTAWSPLYLGGSGVLEAAAPSYEHDQDATRYDPTAGMTNDPVYIRSDLGIDQRGEDPRALVYATLPLESDVEVTGQPRVVLHVSSSTDIASFAVRLCDEAPDGTAQLVTRRALNATHRESHSEPTPLQAGTVYEIRIDMDATSYLFRKGHRLRLYVACADFPYLWPTPKAAMNTIHRGSVYPSRIELPVVPARETPPVSFAPSEFDQGERKAVAPNWRVARDTKSVSVEWGGAGHRVTMTAMDADSPAEMVLDAVAKTSFVTPRGTIDTEGRICIRSDAESFHARLHVDIIYGGEPYFHRDWERVYPRKCR